MPTHNAIPQFKTSMAILVPPTTHPKEVSFLGFIKDLIGLDQKESPSDLMNRVTHPIHKI